MDRRHKGFFYRFRHVFKLLAILLFAAAALTGAYYLSKFGPSRVDPGAAVLEFDEEKGAQLQAEAAEFETTFRERVAQRPPTDEDYGVLNDAIAKLSEYIELRGGSHSETYERREALYDLRDEYRGKALFEESQLEEERGLALLESDANEEALSKLRRAHYLQRTINEDYDRSSYADARRLTRLDREVQRLEAQPIFEASVEKEVEADQAVEAERFGRAKLLLGEAIKLQKQVNMDYRTLRFADLGRLADLEEKLASLESSDAFEEIEAITQKGRELEAQSRFAEAAEAYQTAYRKQRQLNEEHPKSRFADPRRLDHLQDLHETTLSRDVGDSILQELQELDQALREQRVPEAIEILRILEPKTQQFTEQFPRSKILPEDAPLKLQYLRVAEDEIGLLQDRLLGQLIPIEGGGGTRMLRTEVGQALYESVMLGANPSRNVGPRLPVDSPNWTDANDFAERVSWLLARPARLPDQDEFYAALGSLRYVDLLKASWNQENSGDVTHEIGAKEPNAQGFHDLLGNVSEWLLSDSLPGEGEAYLAGGSATTSIDVLAEVPLEISNRRARNRFAGFRVVVDFNDE